ncbi:hypothetical protein BH11PSE3_BH11PSE3_06420 [soil metagenome]
MKLGILLIGLWRAGSAAGAVGGVASDAAAQAARPAPPPASSLIDLNNASRDELMTLDGIGEVRADAIIRSRPLRAKTDLVERRLIPESLYDKISDKVMARAPPPPPPTPATRPAAPKRS